MKKNLRFAVIGTGFWANYQIAAWKELEGAELVALYDKAIPKAEAMAHKFGVSRVFDRVEDLLKKRRLTSSISSPTWIRMLRLPKWLRERELQPFVRSLWRRNYTWPSK